MNQQEKEISENGSLKTTGDVELLRMFVRINNLKILDDTEKFLFKFATL